MVETETKIPVRKLSLGQLEASQFYLVPFYWANKTAYESKEDEFQKFKIPCANLSCRRPTVRFYDLGVGSYNGYGWSIPQCYTSRWMQNITATKSYSTSKSYCTPSNSTRACSSSFNGSTTEKTVTSSGGGVGTYMERDDATWEGNCSSGAPLDSICVYCFPTSVGGKCNEDGTSMTCSYSEGNPLSAYVNMTASASLSNEIPKTSAWAKAKQNANSSNYDQEFNTTVGLRVNIASGGSTSVFLGRTFKLRHYGTPTDYLKVWIKKEIKVFRDREIFEPEVESEIVEHVVTNPDKTDACRNPKLSEPNPMDFESFNLGSYALDALSSGVEMDIIGTCEVIAWSFLKDYTPPLNEPYPFGSSGFPPYKIENVEL